MLPNRRWLAIAALATCLAVVGSEAGWQAWLALRPPGPDSPVFNWTGGADGTDRSGTEAFAYAMETYQADRGRWVDLPPDGNISVQVQIIEWDNIEDGPMMEVKQHAPEICNVAMGYAFLGVEQPRVWNDRYPLRFDCTAFRSPAGQTVHMFKAAWMAGVGNLPLANSGENRLARLVASLQKRAGAARVMQVGVFGAGSSDEAWGICERNVLGECVWK